MAPNKRVGVTRMQPVSSVHLCRSKELTISNRSKELTISNRQDVSAIVGNRLTSSAVVLTSIEAPIAFHY